MEYVSFSIALPELDRVRGQARRRGQGFGECLGGREAGPKHFSYMERGIVWDQLLKGWLTAGSQDICLLAFCFWYITMCPPVCAFGFLPE